MKKFLIVGAGQMGAGIAQSAAQAGYQVQLSDISSELVERGIAKIDKALARQVDKGRLQEGEKAEIMGRISAAPGLEAAADADLVIEGWWRTGRSSAGFSGSCPRLPGYDDSASNTSSISITEIAVTPIAPKRVIGMHFMNPSR